MSLETVLSTNNPASEQLLPEKQPLTKLVTVQQRTAFAMYLIDSAVEPADFSFYDLDGIIFAQLIQEAELLPPSTKLSLAISILSEVTIDVTLLEQQSVLRTLLMKTGAR